MNVDPLAPPLDREREIARWLAIVLVVLIVVLWVTRLLLALRTGSLIDQGGPVDVAYVAAAIAGSGLLIAVAWLIATRQPRNAIGWLVFAIPLFGAVGFFVGDYATWALETHPGSLPFGRAAAWVDNWLIVPMLVVFIPIFLLFPDGRLPSRRWRPALGLLIGSAAIATLALALTPGPMTGRFADLTDVAPTNPLALTRVNERTIESVTAFAGFAAFVSAVLAGAAIVVRFRAASADVRQQIRWLVFVGVAFLAEIVIATVGVSLMGDRTSAGELVGNLSFLMMFLTLVVGIPVACGIAILKYHLYDLDVVIRKTVVFGLLALFITGVYAAIVAVVSIRFEGSQVGSFAAAATLAVLFAPARDRARRVADRLVYGRRATPYEVLAEFSDRVGDAYAADDVLQRMAQVLMEGTGASGARVLLRIGDEQREAVSVGEHGAEETLVPVLHQGDELGSLAVSMPPADPMNPARRQLVEDLASQAGLVLRNVRLIEELKASRQRLVAAQDEERRKIERNIHDGAQQQLVALAVQLKLAEQLVGTDPSKERALLAALGARAAEALDDLRDLARGVYPPLLADKGLAAALDAQARKAAVPTTIAADGIGRFSQEVESTVYFCTLEALNNVAKYAHASQVRLSLTQADGHLTFRVTDDGRGFDPGTTGYGTGLRGIADRLEALGGTITITSARGSGTTVTGSLPSVGAVRPA